MSGEFASRGVANAGLTTGIIGTSLAGLMALNGNNGNGLLGGLLGGGCNNQVSALMSEISQLKAEKYSDQSIANVYTALRNETTALQDRLLDKYINPMAVEIADSRVR